jgi:hypothetical protein
MLRALSLASFNALVEVRNQAVLHGILLKIQLVKAPTHFLQLSGQSRNCEGMTSNLSVMVVHIRRALYLYYN